MTVFVVVNLHDVLHIRLLVGSQIAAEMREAVYNRLGLTGCAGVASNKLLAKLVSGVFKPNQQTVLLPESSQDLIHSLNHIKEIPGKTNIFKKYMLVLLYCFNFKNYRYM